jgi:hypothetical protein
VRQVTAYSKSQFSKLVDHVAAIAAAAAIPHRFSCVDAETVIAAGNGTMPLTAAYAAQDEDGAATCVAGRPPAAPDARLRPGKRIDRSPPHG